MARNEALLYSTLEWYQRDLVQVRDFYHCPAARKLHPSAPHGVSGGHVNGSNTLTTHPPARDVSVSGGLRMSQKPHLHQTAMRGTSSNDNNGQMENLNLCSILAVSEVIHLLPLPEWCQKKYNWNGVQRKSRVSSRNTPSIQVSDENHSSYQNQENFKMCEKRQSADSNTKMADTLNYLTMIWKHLLLKCLNEQ